MDDTESRAQVWHFPGGCKEIEPGPVTAEDLRRGLVGYIWRYRRPDGEIVDARLRSVDQAGERVLGWLTLPDGEVIASFFGPGEPDGLAAVWNKD
jgi:hypothetical protein